MRRRFACILGAISGCCLLPMAAHAGKANPANYPLRVHIVFRNGIRHYHGYGGVSSLEEVEGMGGADLFENGQPRGFDFTYQCGQPITPEPGYETFMARWKKADRVIEIVMPVIGGKPGEVNACDLKVTMKSDTVYVRRQGAVSEVPIAHFKEWMVKHQYDPEHGKDTPVNPPAAQMPAAQPSATQQTGADGPSR